MGKKILNFKYMLKPWVKIPFWLKCGIITDLLLIIIGGLVLLTDKSIALSIPFAILIIFLPAIFLPSFIRDLLFDTGGFLGPEPNITAVIYSLLFWFLVASVIGFLIKKIRSRKKPTI